MIVISGIRGRATLQHPFAWHQTGVSYWVCASAHAQAPYRGQPAAAAGVSGPAVASSVPAPGGLEVTLAWPDQVSVK